MLRSPAFLRGVPALNTDAAGPAPTDAFGPFRVLHQIGAGALGPVFRAYHQEEDRLVAIKLFRLDLPPERVHQLVAELEQLIAADLSHPAIATPIAAGIAGATAYLALDFVAADSLDVVVRDSGALSPVRALRVARQVGEALDAAAAIGILHGGLHPRDLLIADDDARMTGLGIARAVERVGIVAPVRRPYTAAERAAGAAWDQRADVFSLAALIFELMTAKRIAGTGEQAASALPDLPGANGPALRDLFARALEESPDERLAHCHLFVEELERALEPSPVRAPRKRRKAAAVVETETEVPEPDEADLFLPETPEHTQEFFSTANESQVLAFADDGAAEDERAAPARPIEPPPTVPDAGDLHLAAGAAHRDAAHLDHADLHIVPPPERDAFRPAAVENRMEYAIEESQRGVPIERPAPRFAATIEETRSALWPIGLALVLGIAIGFGVAMVTLGRDNTESVTAGNAPVRPAREVVEPALVTEPPPAASVTPAQPPVATSAPPPTPEAGSSASPSVSPEASQAPAAAPSAAVPAQPSGEPAARVPPAREPSSATSASAAAGRILVRSTPTGARVTLDGREVGSTPLTLRDVSRGSHTIRVAREGYRPMERRITISATRPSQSLTLELVRDRTAAAPPPAAPAGSAALTGSLAVDSRPSGARVFIDGRLVGTTPLTLPALAAGEHAIYMEADGYQRWTSSVRITGGEQSKIAGSLTER